MSFCHHFAQPHCLGPVDRLPACGPCLTSAPIRLVCSLSWGGTGEGVRLSPKSPSGPRGEPSRNAGSAGHLYVPVAGLSGSGPGPTQTWPSPAPFFTCSWRTVWLCRHSAGAAVLGWGGPPKGPDSRIRGRKGWGSRPPSLREEGWGPGPPGPKEEGLRPCTPGSEGERAGGPDSRVRGARRELRRRPQATRSPNRSSSVLGSSR